MQRYRGFWDHTKEEGGPCTRMRAACFLTCHLLEAPPIKRKQKRTPSCPSPSSRKTCCRCWLFCDFPLQNKDIEVCAALSLGPLPWVGGDPVITTLSLPPSQHPCVLAGSVMSSTVACSLGSPGLEREHRPLWTGKHAAVCPGTGAPVWRNLQTAHSATSQHFSKTAWLGLGPDCPRVAGGLEPGTGLGKQGLGASRVR